MEAEEGSAPDGDSSNLDPVVEMDIDLHNFSIGQLEKDITRGLETSEESVPIEVCFCIANLTQKLTKIAQISDDESQGAEPDDSETSVTSEPSVITQARELLAEAEEENSKDLDIFDIVDAQLKEIKKLKDISAPRCIKMTMHLTAVIQYVRLRERYRRHPNCKAPCLKASLAIARRMGKQNGDYFARQIRKNEAYLLRHKHLPPTKQGAKHGQYTLLDNEAVVHKVRTYLAAQSLGAITPRELCQHVNQIILPALEISGKNSSISERTAITWLKKLGYTCKDVKKGIYHDGHERPDVVEARKKFLDDMLKYEP